MNIKNNFASIFEAILKNRVFVPIKINHYLSSTLETQYFGRFSEFLSDFGDCS